MPTFFTPWRYIVWSSQFFFMFWCIWYQRHLGIYSFFSLVRPKQAGSRLIPTQLCLFYDTVKYISPGWTEFLEVFSSSRPGNTGIQDLPLNCFCWMTPRVSSQLDAPSYQVCSASACVSRKKAWGKLCLQCSEITLVRQTQRICTYRVSHGTLTGPAWSSYNWSLLVFSHSCSVPRGPVEGLQN